MRASRPFVVLLLAGLSTALGQSYPELRRFSLTWENDAVAGSDKHYTQGARISYWTEDEPFQWLSSLKTNVPSPGFEPGAIKLGFTLAHDIYTPDALESVQVVTNDRPYAGWFFGTIALQRRGQGPGNFLVMETLGLDLGFVGPEALAAETQKEWHGDDPLGWDNQLKTEAGVELHYTRRYLLSVAFWNGSWGAQLLPHFRGSAGNIRTCVGAGGTIRIGYNILNEFDWRKREPNGLFGVYLSTGIEGRWVARNIFLDGNTFRSSHRVDKEPFVGDWRVGFGFSCAWFDANVFHNFRSQEFRDQGGYDSFGGASVAFKF